MRKTIKIMTAILCAGLLFGCGKKVAKDDAPAAIKPALTKVVSRNTAESEEISMNKAEGVRFTDEELAAVSSNELAVFMGNGINLGNTLEAVGDADFGTKREIAEYEQLWGQPLTTPQMIADMKAAGFDTLRIPVAWTDNMDITGDELTVDPALIARVKEIVGYAYDNDMFVIINEHWDRGWWGMFGSKNEAKREHAMEIYKQIWIQVAREFKDYDHHLIFEGGNEELGDRLNDVNGKLNPEGTSLTKDECYECANRINQQFVDIVRNTGGGNADRFLLIPGYDTDISRTLDPRFKMPKDTVSGKLLLSVHFYTPWDFCGSGKKTWGSSSERKETDRLMEKLFQYGAEYGIIVGECAVLPDKEGKLKDDALIWFEQLYANCDLYGYCPVLWNTGDYLDKNTHKMITDEMADFFKKYSYENEMGLSRDEVRRRAEERINEIR